MLAGIVLFSGSLYALALTGPEMIGQANAPETTRLLGLFTLGNMDGVLDRKFLHGGTVRKFPEQPDLTEQVSASLKVWYAAGEVSVTVADWKVLRLKADITVSASARSTLSPRRALPGMSTCSSTMPASPGPAAFSPSGRSRPRGSSLK